jgi:hypothetical protein
MTNIRLSDKGRAFLRKGNAAMQVATAIAEKKDNLQSGEELVVKIDEHNSVTVKSAAAYNQDLVVA